MKARLGRQVGVISGLAIVTAIIAFTLLIATISAQQRATRDARAHERTATRAQRVGALVVDAETSMRGFIITGRVRFLEPYSNAQRELPGLTADLRTEAGGGEEQRLADSVANLANAYMRQYAQPTVDAAREDRASAATGVRSEEGKLRVDQLRAEVRALALTADRAAAASESSARHRASRARTVAIVAGILIVAILALLVVELRRRVLVPVARATSAAGRIGGGDLAVRLPVDRQDEIGELGAALNAMAVQLRETSDELEAQHTELESQNAELEAQSVELETQATELEQRGFELSETNAVLLTRGAELETATEQLKASSERLRLYAEVSEALARVPDGETRARRLLERLGGAVDCPVGAIYLRSSGGDDALHLAAQRGLDDAPALGEDAGGLVARSIEERKRVVASYPETSLEVVSFGARASIRHEVHMPLLLGDVGDEVLGVVSLGRTSAEPFTQEQLDLVEHLVSTSAVALFNAVVSTQREQAAATLRAVFDSVGECILVISPDRELLIANPPMDALARKVIGIGPDEPWDISDLSVGFRRESRDPDAMESQARELAADPFARNRAEIELPRFGMFLERYTSPVIVGDNAIARIVVIRDATEERQAERAKDDLMSTVSHELRTPLAAILGFTELLTSRAFSPEEQEEYLTTVHEQSVRLASLVDDFLDLQRLEARGLDANEPFDLRPVIVDTVQFYGAQSAAHRLVYDGTSDPLRVTGDQDHLRRVLSNLLSNAIKYSPGGGDVRVEAEIEADRVRVAVVDRGVGIPAAQRARVFERFFRVDSPNRSGISGTGLGLALVRDIVQAHGGEVGVDSVEGEGSRFWVTLPAAV
ncbi:MAG: CHASE3 domain-containing protein [Solirubrobacteraceae bacterium]|nr:CHASE3 domain-containing protein [Solirubrobacteraceae bacterium]